MKSVIVFSVSLLFVLLIIPEAALVNSEEPCSDLERVLYRCRKEVWCIFISKCIFLLRSLCRNVIFLYSKDFTVCNKINIARLFELSGLKLAKG